MSNNHWNYVHDGNARMMVLCWNGDSNAWERFKEDFDELRMSEDISKSRSLAAALRRIGLTGAAKTVAKKLKEDQILEPASFARTWKCKFIKG